MSDLNEELVQPGPSGNNRLDILLFQLGEQTFALNVFRVREVGPAPKITRTPNMPAGVCGLASLRGHVIPVIALPEIMGFDVGRGESLMVVEFNRRTIGFLVTKVDRILPVDCERVRPTQAITSGEEGFVTAVTELDDGRLVSIIDVESILDHTFGEFPADAIGELPGGPEMMVFYVDDSVVARRRIGDVLGKLGVGHQSAANGEEAWRQLTAMAEQAAGEEVALTSKLSLVLTDAEMPQVDGYELTRRIRADARFDAIPVVMHSSLAMEANREQGRRVGAAAYVPKFNAQELANTLRPLLEQAIA